MPDQNYVEIRDLSFSHQERVILSDINMQIPKGKIVAILGPSGTGKTTLLRLIGAQLHPDKGEVIVNGQNIHHLSEAALSLARRQIGVLFQSAALFSELSVYENVAFPLREKTNLSDSLIRSVVLMKLETVGLRGATDLMPAELSGGMARRVALARAIALDPALILYDEPFAGQDPISMGVIIKLITALNKTLGMTTVIISHDVQETLAIADYVYLLSNSHILAEGTPEAIQKNNNPAVIQFIQGLPDGTVPFHYPAKAYFEDLLHAR